MIQFLRTSSSCLEGNTGKILSVTIQCSGGSQRDEELFPGPGEKGEGESEVCFRQRKR